MVRNITWVMRTAWVRHRKYCVSFCCCCRHHHRPLLLTSHIPMHTDSYIQYTHNIINHNIYSLFIAYIRYMFWCVMAAAYACAHSVTLRHINVPEEMCGRSQQLLWLVCSETRSSLSYLWTYYSTIANNIIEHWIDLNWTKRNRTEKVVSLTLDKFPLLHPYKCQYCIPLNKCFLFLFFGCFASHSISYGFAVFMFDVVCSCVCVWVGVIFFIHSVFIHNPECVFIYFFLFFSTIFLTMYICVARLCRSISME